MKPICIIGAGAAGLTCLKSLLEVGIKPVVFEKSHHIGGLWNFDENLEDGGGPAYKSLITNTSRYMMAFSDFPFDKSAPDFPDRESVLSYLKDYAAQYNLLDHIRFNTEVIKVEKICKIYSVTFQKDGKQEILDFDWVIIAHGRHENTYIPPIQGLKNFTGEIFHSKQYTAPERFKNKNVLVIGGASSAMDIASEISEYCSYTLLSIRSKSWLVPRNIEGKAYDLHLTSFTAKLPNFIREKAFRKKLFNAYRWHPKKALSRFYGSDKTRLKLETDRFVPNDLLLQRIAEDKIDIKPVVKSVYESRVTFSNNTTSDIDAIIFGTGYQIDIPFMAQNLTGLKNNHIPLYHQVFSPVSERLAMCGMCYIVGPIIPALEMQGRYISEVIAGQVTLPSKQVMLSQVEKHFSVCKKRNINPMRVQTLSYLDNISKEIGAYPKFISNVGILSKLLFGPIVAARYRLNGRNSKNKIAQKILNEL